MPCLDSDRMEAVLSDGSASRLVRTATMVGPVGVVLPLCSNSNLRTARSGPRRRPRRAQNEAPLRISIVAAHYPPDFISGATLAAQRVAEGLAERGHEVFVFAGYIGPSAPDDQVRSRAKRVSVQWIFLEDGLDWSSRENYVNSRIGLLFDEFIMNVKPDVVHFEMLQAMGAPLVQIAKSRGAATVVTMHDFWWLCPRLFLADRELHPCPLLVEFGGCECQVGSSAKVKRERYLRDALASVDQILVPSAIVRGILVANGIDGDRIAVDENPVVVPDVEPPDVDVLSNDVRFLYVGGSNDLKGWRLLRTALRNLARCDGWSLTAYGIEEGYARMLEPPQLTERVRMCGQFDPVDLGTVMGNHDVLIIPSIMRETFSIAAREALASGLAVITSDSFGPEDVVKHGENGLVFESGNAEQLAFVLRSVVEDRSMLKDFKTAAGRVILRGIEEQCEQLEILYSPLVESGKRPLRGEEAHQKSGRIRGLLTEVNSLVLIVGIDGAPLRYRAYNIAEAARLVGISASVWHYRDPEAIEEALRANVVVFYRVPMTREVLNDIRLLKAAGIRVMFSLDDLLVDEDIAPEIPALRILSGSEADLWREGMRRYRATLEECGEFIGSTSFLSQHVFDMFGMPSYVVLNGFSHAQYQLALQARSARRTPGPVRIGYLSGSNTHAEDWAMIEASVGEVMRADRKVELWLVGQVEPSSRLGAFGSRIVRIPHMNWRYLPSLLRDIDVNVAPLVQGSRFNDAKSAVKWLEASLVGTATVASGAAGMVEVIVDGKNGVIAESADSWARALLELVESEELRMHLGRSARRDAEINFGPWRTAWQIRNVLSQGAVPSRSSSDGNGGPVWSEPKMAGNWLSSSEEPSLSPDTGVDYRLALYGDSDLRWFEGVSLDRGEVSVSTSKLARGEVLRKLGGLMREPDAGARVRASLGLLAQSWRITHEGD